MQKYKHTQLLVVVCLLFVRVNLACLFTLEGKMAQFPAGVWTNKTRIRKQL